MKFVLAAGGSAGHVYPAINTARAILELDPSAGVTIMGTDRGLRHCPWCLRLDSHLSYCRRHLSPED